MKALVVIASKGFQDLELEGTRDGLLSAGFEVVLASTDKGDCIGKFGSKEKASKALREVKIEDYDRVAFIGGPGAHVLADNTEARDLAVMTVNARKPLGAICIAPTILAKAGVLQGKEATVWDDGEGTQINLLKFHGATYVDTPVVHDGLIVTANGPDAAPEFGKVFASM